MARGPAVRTEGFGTTVFAEFSALANAHGAINLGQGFPDFDGPDEVKEAAQKAIRDGLNQYAIGSGAKDLRLAIAEHESRFYGRTVDPETEVTVTSGATEAIFDCILGLVNPGEEVIVFEPFYDSYVPAVEMAGATPRYLTLRPPDERHATFWYDPAELESLFNAKTAAIVVNTPHNPTGKIFSNDELRRIGELCARHDAVVIADEVYEHIFYAPPSYVRVAAVPGLAERTVAVSSAGKSFSLTGWKIGWVVAPPKLRLGVQRIHQFNTFATASPLQAAFATALRLPDAYFAKLAADYRDRRDFLVGALREAGFRPFVPDGTYFILADYSALSQDDDYTFCRRLTEKHGVAAIPPSAFYSKATNANGAPRRWARFAFCKTQPVLDEAARRLRALRR